MYIEVVMLVCQMLIQVECDGCFTVEGFELFRTLVMHQQKSSSEAVDNAELLMSFFQYDKIGSLLFL